VYGVEAGVKGGLTAFFVAEPPQINKKNAEK